MTKRFALRITGGAAADLTTLYDYVSDTRSADEAEALLDTLMAKAAGLETFPYRGSIPPEITQFGANAIRQTHAGPYRIIYRIAGTTVYVMLIADGRRDLRALLERRLLNG